jgi:hypothetical protein
VAFYNQRGTAEQHIKEGKNAIKWTPLSCRKFRDNAVRLSRLLLEEMLTSPPKKRARTTLCCKGWPMPGWMESIGGSGYLDGHGVWPGART